MTVLVLVEHDNQHLHPNTKQVLTAALQLGANPTLVVIGHQCQAVAEAAATMKGVGAVWLIQDEQLAHPSAEAISKVLRDKVQGVQYILAPASTFGKNSLPRLAALLDVAQVSDVVRIVDAETVVHPIYAGNALETVRMLDSIRLMTIRPTAFAAATETQAASPIEQMPVTLAETGSCFVSQALSVSKRPELGSARRIVSGGRGLQSAEKFKLVEELADALGAAVGASRAAVDAGFVPNDYQVGQTGKVVAPELYIALGISGAIQHLAGMKDSKVIVAINKDPDAPIFQLADYGLVGDLFALVPELIAKLR